MTKKTYQTGLAAQRICRLALRLKFYRILATRYKTPVGEIDIIAARGHTVVAVEVKARATREAAIESISPEQQSRIARALPRPIYVSTSCWRRPDVGRCISKTHG
jgi:putative endonuclease